MIAFLIVLTYIVGLVPAAYIFDEFGVLGGFACWLLSPIVVPTLLLMKAIR